MDELTIVKIGGKIIDNHSDLDLFIDSFVQLSKNVKGKLILVHGGGIMATKFAEQLGLESKMIEGRRITDAENLKLIIMVYAGLINKTIVAKLQAKGVNALGLSACDMNIMTAKRREVKEINYGYVGDIVKVNNTAISQLLNLNNVLVIAPISHDGKGQLLNTNADTIASELAISLTCDYAVKLIYSFDKGGVLLNAYDSQSVINELNNDLYIKLYEQGNLHSGIIPKIKSALNAYNSGVKQIIIGDLIQLMNNKNKGTKIIGNKTKGLSYEL